MTVWQLSILAKEAEKMHDDGLISVNTYTARPTEVHLNHRAFMELFPACYADEDPYTYDGRVYQKRSIRIDGIEFFTVLEVTNG